MKIEVYSYPTITLPNPSHQGWGYVLLPLPSVGEGWGEGHFRMKANGYLLSQV